MDKTRENVLSSTLPTVTELNSSLTDTSQNEGKNAENVENAENKFGILDKSRQSKPSCKPLRLMGLHTNWLRLDKV